VPCHYFHCRRRAYLRHARQRCFERHYLLPPPPWRARRSMPLTMTREVAMPRAAPRSVHVARMSAMRQQRDAQRGDALLYFRRRLRCLPIAPMMPAAARCRLYGSMADAAHFRRRYCCRLLIADFCRFCERLPPYAIDYFLSLFRLPPRVFIFGFSLFFALIFSCRCCMLLF